MKIAYYEENNYHTEIMGTFIEYFSKINADVTVYNTSDMSSTVSYFKNLSNFALKPHAKLITEYKLYDKIFIGTSNDTKDFIDKINPKEIDYDKLIFICHLAENIKPEYKNLIVVTPLNLRLKINPNIKYIMPIHNYIPYIMKPKKENILSIVGRFKKNHRDKMDILKLVSTYSMLNYQIRIFARKENFVPDCLHKISKIYPDRIKIFIKMSTKILDMYLKESKYILPLVSKDSWYHKDRLSGSIALAYIYNIPMVIDNTSHCIYQTEGCIVYQNSITEVIKDIVSMPDNEYQKLVTKFTISKNKIIGNNNEILGKIVAT